MELPEIDISILPGLETLTGLFGSISRIAQDDSIVILMTYVFEIIPPGSP